MMGDDLELSRSILLNDDFARAPDSQARRLTAKSRICAVSSPTRGAQSPLNGYDQRVLPLMDTISTQSAVIK